MDVHSDSFWVLSHVLFAISTLFVLLRLYTRLVIVKFFGVDDGMIILATVCSLGIGVVIWMSHRLGLGKHIHEVPFENRKTMFILLFAHCHLYLIAAHSIRASLVVLYRRLSVSPGFLKICWIYLIANLAVYFAFTFITVFLCRPLSAFWNKDLKTECINPINLSILNGWVLIFLDLSAVLLPMPTVWKLPLPRRQKFWLLILFGLGLFVCIASYFRVHSFTDSPDITYMTETIYAWTVVEITCGLIAASFVTFKPLILPLLPRAFAGSGRGSGTAVMTVSPLGEMGDVDNRRKGAVLNFTEDMILGDDLTIDEIEETMEDTASRHEQPSEKAGLRTSEDEITEVGTTSIAGGESATSLKEKPPVSNDEAKESSGIITTSTLEPAAAESSSEENPATVSEEVVCSLQEEPESSPAGKETTVPEPAKLKA